MNDCGKVKSEVISTSAPLLIPHSSLPPTPLSSGDMAHVIAQPCIGTKDHSCVEVCPVDCIHPTNEEGTFESIEQLFIDPDVCIDCGLCVDECPVQAIFPQEDLPAEWSSFIEKNANYFK